MLVKDIIKKTLHSIQKEGLTITPDLYAKTFCRLAKKEGLILEECFPAKKYIKKLEPHLQELANKKEVAQLDELVVFLMANFDRELLRLKNTGTKLNKTTSDKLCKTYSDLIISSLEPSFTQKLNSKIAQTSQRLEKNSSNPSAKLIDDINDLIFDRIQTDRLEILEQTTDVEISVDKILVSVDGFIELGKAKNKSFKDLSKELSALESGSFVSIKEKLSLLTTSLIAEISGLVGDLKNKRSEIADLKLTINALTKQLKKAQEETKTDFLTNVLSKRGLQDEFRKLESNFLRKNIDYCIIFFDIDHFKNINDTYGHAAGDMILKAFGVLLKSQTRPEDIVGRFGGEEFVVATSLSQKDEILSFAQRLRQSVEKSVYSYENHKIKITVSGGIAFRTTCGGLQETIKTADELLYSSKNNGRNQISI